VAARWFLISFFLFVDGSWYFYFLKKKKIKNKKVKKKEKGNSKNSHYRHYRPFLAGGWGWGSVWGGLPPPWSADSNEPTFGAKKRGQKVTLLWRAVIKVGL
jgi:cbb3-type cytochrome oxidase subunit 3